MTFLPFFHASIVYVILSLFLFTLFNFFCIYIFLSLFVISLSLSLSVSFIHTFSFFIFLFHSKLFLHIYFIPVCLVFHFYRLFHLFFHNARYFLYLYCIFLFITIHVPPFIHFLRYVHVFFTSFSRSSFLNYCNFFIISFVFSFIVVSLFRSSILFLRLFNSFSAPLFLFISFPIRPVTRNFLVYFTFRFFHNFL